MSLASQPSQVRYAVDPRDVPPIKAARRLHLTVAEFEAVLPRLQARGFPPPDPDTGNYDLKMIDEWMDDRAKRRNSTPMIQARDARGVVDERIERM